jgi:hypothetical protein
MLTEYSPMMEIRRKIVKMISPLLVNFYITHFFHGSTQNRLFNDSLFVHPEIRSSIIEKCRIRLDNLQIDEFLKIGEDIHCDEAEGVRKSLCEEYIRSWQSRLEGLSLIEFPKIVRFIHCDRTNISDKALCEEFIKRWHSGIANISDEQVIEVGVKIDYEGGSTLIDQMVLDFIEEWRNRVNRMNSEKLREIGVTIQNSLNDRGGHQPLPPLCRALLECILKGRHLSSFDELQDLIVLLQEFCEIGTYYPFIPYLLKLPVQCQDREQRTLLRAMILQDCPAFLEQGHTELEKVIQLRTWAHNKGKFSSEQLLIESHPENRFYSRGPEELYTHFMFETGGAWCGGFAYFLQQIYELLGYESYTVNMGIPGTRITHVTTIVRIYDEDTSILSVQDPFFDVTYKDRNGKVLDYFQLLNLITSGSIDKVEVKEGENREIDFIIRSDETLQDYRWFVINPMIKRQFRDRFVYQARVTIVSFDEYFKATEKLASLGYPPNILSLFILPFNIHRNTDDSWELLEQALRSVAK